MDSGRDLFAYFEPTDTRLLSNKIPFHYPTLGDNVNFITKDSPGSDLEHAQIVIFGYPDSAESIMIRKQLYSLSNHFPSLSILDMGTLRKGKTKADTDSGLRDVIAELGRKQKTIIIIGGKTKDTLLIYNGYSLLEQRINICGIDAGIPLSTEKTRPKSHYLNKILLNPENLLFDYSHLAYQAYFTSPAIIELLDQLFFNHIRLGRIRQDIRESEPEFRNTDILSFSMSAIRESDAPSSDHPGPNGLYAEEACQLTRYAGLSERLTCFFLNDTAPNETGNQPTATLAAQMIWHFLQGYFQRKMEYPFTDITNYQKFIVNVPQVGHDINFYKSPKTNRWWLEVPYPETKYSRSLYVACTHSDYQIACEGEIPDRWWKNFQRLS
jgi:formiminoglutamase